MEATPYQNQLSGDWTISGVVTQLRFLMNQHHSDLAAGNNTMMIDCRNIERMDMTGMQLLYTWLQCVKTKGVTPYITNIPEELHTTITTLGYKSLLSCHINSDEPLPGQPYPAQRAEINSVTEAAYGG